jgi:hypothetical protein
MARLACVKHQSRVLVLEDRVIHRSDRTLCKSRLQIGGKKLTADEVRKFSSESGCSVGLNTRDSI